MCLRGSSSRTTVILPSFHLFFAPLFRQWGEHSDFHFARDLQRADQPQAVRPSGAAKSAGGGGRPAGGGDPKGGKRGKGLKRSKEADGNPLKRFFAKQGGE